MMAKRKFRVRFRSYWKSNFIRRYSTKDMGIVWNFYFNPFMLKISQYATVLIVLNFEISFEYPVVGSPEA